jgi:transposase
MHLQNQEDGEGSDDRQGEVNKDFDALANPESLNYLNLYSFLVSKGITTIVVNPLIIANFNKLSLRRTKTDKKDALTIARYLFLNRDVVSTLPTFQATTGLRVRDLVRERGSLF